MALARSTTAGDSKPNDDQLIEVFRNNLTREKLKNTAFTQQTHATFSELRQIDRQNRLNPAPPTHRLLDSPTNGLRIHNPKPRTQL